jgi:hypothetical protein
MALYRLHAAKCIDIAIATFDSESRLALLDMARAWRLLADQANKNSQTATLVHEDPEPRQYTSPNSETTTASHLPLSAPAGKF